MKYYYGLNILYSTDIQSKLAQGFNVEMHGFTIRAAPSAEQTTFCFDSTDILNFIILLNMKWLIMLFYFDQFVELEKNLMN